MTNESQMSTESEIIRFGTYIGWPGLDIHNNPVKPSTFALAKAGFFYSGQGDEVQCFACGLRVRDWERHNDPWVVHATRNPNCPFVINVDSGNKPVFVPCERDYAAIQCMLRETGQRVALTAGSGASYSSSSLISDTLRKLYGETLVSPEPRQTNSHPLSGRRPVSNTLRLEDGRDQKMSGSNKGAGNPTSTTHASNTPPPRRSSTSDNNSCNAASRPQFHRARSCAADPTPGSGRNSGTIVNRQSSGPGIDHAEYQNSEEARLATFDGWSGIKNVSAREFAQAGFIYIGPPDRVQCVFCSGILRNWNDSDRPFEEHQKHFPQCSFVKDSLPGINVARPRHPKYKADPSRLNSFKNWPMSRNPQPADLAKAGFFYVGHGDSVKCFFCDGGLRNWEPNDDPWREHARWFPNCVYVKQSKGQSFIDNVLSDTNLTEYSTASVDQTELKNVVRGAARREVDPREVTARMDSPFVKTVIKMDIPKKMVKKAIERRLAENGEDFSSAEALMEAIFALNEGGDSGDGKETAEAKEDEGLECASGPPSNGSSGHGNHDSLKLMEENRLLKEQRLCKICMDEEVCVAFLPCGHLVCCGTCAPAMSVCPICRAKIRGTVRTYLS